MDGGAGSAEATIDNRYIMVGNLTFHSSKPFANQLMSSAIKNGVPPMMLLLALALCTRATTFSEFDAMRDYAKSELIAEMIDSAEQALNAEGSPELALKMRELFINVAPGKHISKGLRQFNKNLEIVDAHYKENPSPEPHHMETVFFVTLSDNGIELSQRVRKAVLSTTLHFHPMTNAEFHALPPSEQKRVVRLLSGMAIQDYGYRDMGKDETFLGIDKDNLENLDYVWRNEFPSSGDQPGFSGVVKEIERDRAEAPNRQGIVLSIVIYLTDEIAARLRVREKELEGRAVLLPDGRHAYVNNDGGGFLIFEKDGTSHKLEPELEPLANRLRRCMETGGITDGPRAQAVCLQRETGGQNR